MRFWILCLAMFFSCASQAKNDNFEYFISNNSNNILTPENIKNISWSGIKAGFAASFQIKNLTSNKVTQTIEYRLERTEGNRHYFDVVIDGKEQSYLRIMYENGKQYRSYQGKEYNLSDSYNGCLLTIGTCKFRGFSDKMVTMTTVYKNGLWVSNHLGAGRSSRPTTIETVYDKRGLILYSRSTVKSSSLPIKNETLRLK
jgi:hypothetical protein